MELNFAFAATVAELDGKNMDYNCVFLAVYSISREEAEFSIR
jgi:hypothetical protein